MKIVLTLLVRDEEDIVDANLRHHLAAGVDVLPWRIPADVKLAGRR